MFLSTIKHVPVDLAERRALTLAAKSGDQDAQVALLADIVPNLMSIVRRYRHGLEVEDAESVAYTAFLEAVQEYDPARDPDGVGIISILSSRVVQAMTKEANDLNFMISVPERTGKRFWAILRHAEGDEILAAEIAPKFGMASDVFTEIYNRTFGLVSLTVLADYSEAMEEFESSVETRAVAYQALSSLDDPELEIIRRAYGFHDYRPQSDGAVAAEMGMSRQAVQRRRVSALETMREATGVE